MKDWNTPESNLPVEQTTKIQTMFDRSCSVERVVNKIRSMQSGQTLYDVCSRWDIYPNAAKLVRVLEAEGLLTEQLLEDIYDMNDSARESA